MSAVARFSPFAEAPRRIDWTPGMSLAAIARAAGAPDYFFAVGVIRVGGKAYARDLWPCIKPKAGAFVDLCVPMGKGGTGQMLLALGTVALAVASAFVAPYATGLLAGHALYGGGLGLSAGLAAAGGYAAAAVVNIAGQMALRALTPPPARPQAQAAANELSMAGISANPLNPGEPVAAILGRVRASPQQIAPSYTTLENGRLYVHTMVGCHGRCEISDIKINGEDIADIPDIEYETDEGSGGTDTLFLSSDYHVQSNAAVVLSNYKLKEDSAAYYAQLDDQTTPENSYSDFHTFTKRAAATKADIRLIFEGGLVSSSGTACGVALRIDVLRDGETVWQKLPTLHIQDIKKAGPFRQNIRLHFDGVLPAGRWIARNDDINCYAALHSTAVGESFEYNSDTVFDQTAAPTNALPVMTSGTTSGVTVTASSEKSGSEAAWKAADGSGATVWEPALNSLPAWWQVDWGSGNTKTIRSYVVRGGNPTLRPKTWTLSGSDDASTWTEISAFTYTEDVNEYTYLQCHTYAPFRYHRLDVTENNGAASEDLTIKEIRLSEEDSVGSQSDGEATYTLLSRYVNLTRDGADIYLPTDTFPAGKYKIRVRRSWAYLNGGATVLGLGTNTNTYNYVGFSNIACFFDHYVTSGAAVIHTGQKDIQSKTTVEMFGEYFASRPIRAAAEARLARIAIRVPDIAVQSISALFTSYAREWDGAVWSDTPVPSRNPAALYRDALLIVDKNAEPLPGEIIDEDSLETWFDHCATEGLTVDGVVQDRSMADVLQLLASCGRASCRHGGYWGVVIDKDRSADDPTVLLTPDNSRDLGTEISYADVPHGLRVTYLDDADDYAQAETTVYRAGFSESNATDIQAMSYPATASTAAAEAQAVYDLGQLHHRRISYRREVGFIGFALRPGEKVAMASEVLKRDSYYGMVKAITTSAGDVTGFTLYGTAGLSASADQGFDTFGIVIELKQGGTFTAEITETADTAIVTLATPVADTGQFDISRPVAIGALGQETILGILKEKENAGDGVWRLTILPEANEIFA